VNFGFDGFCFTREGEQIGSNGGQKSAQQMFGGVQGTLPAAGPAPMPPGVPAAPQYAAPPAVPTPGAPSQAPQYAAPPAAPVAPAPGAYAPPPMPPVGAPAGAVGLPPIPGR
jgi:hypothetical protein